MRLSYQAQLQLKEIKDYTLKKWGNKQAKKYILGLKETNLLLSKNPHIGLHRPELSSHVFSFPYKRHVLYYKFNDTQLFILAFVHQNMLPKKHLQDKIL